MFLLLIVYSRCIINECYAFSLFHDELLSPDFLIVPTFVSASVVPTRISSNDRASGLISISFRASKSVSRRAKSSNGRAVAPTYRVLADDSLIEDDFEKPNVNINLLLTSSASLDGQRTARFSSVSSSYAQFLKQRDTDKTKKILSQEDHRLLLSSSEWVEDIKDSDPYVSVISRLGK
ncbi:unnamed protein product [Rotaria sp. Silwood2]|nr:unnamed protein product [Rotaria sp. Silwood2]